MTVEDIKTKQLLELQEQCLKNEIEFTSIQKLLTSEKIKKLQKRNHYIQQTIDSEIENVLSNEDK